MFCSNQRQSCSTNGMFQRLIGLTKMIPVGIEVKSKSQFLN